MSNAQSKMASAYTLSEGAPAALFNDELIEQLRTELGNFQKLVTGKRDMLLALCDIGGVDGHQLDSSSCAPISDHTIQAVLQHVVQIIVNGAKLNGKPKGWSVGFMGSRWMDIPAEPFGLDYIRVAFYSKKHYKGDDGWDCPKPYLMRVTCEKAR